jgi:hypothetical protein
MADAPTDTGVEPQIWDAARITDYERIMLDSGRQIYTVAACHDATASLAAITQVVIESASPSWAQQTITAGPNEHMAAINEQLGYQVSYISRDWELDLTARQ